MPIEGSDARIPGRLARAGVGDTLAVLARVVVPTLGKGIFIRRPAMVALAARLGLDAGAVRCLQGLRRRTGADVLLLAVPGRRQAVVLSRHAMEAVLDGTPDPFSPATREKIAALGHFEPRVSLVSGPADRPRRRAFNDAFLESDRPRHTMAERIEAVVADEVEVLLGGPVLRWPAFTEAWHRAVRRVILGDAARGDRALTDALARLRRAGNWAVLHPGRPALNRRFHRNLARVLARGEPGSVAARIAARRGCDDPEVLDQVTHWLFAFDAAGIATYRALALAAARGVAETAAGPALLRACLLEAVRLWPTTPAVLRETVRDVAFDDGILPKGTQVLVYVPFFHRDADTSPAAHGFAPELWLEPGPAAHRALIPFSAGPGLCPAHHLVPLMGSAVLAAILRRRRPVLRPPGLPAPDRPLPGTLDHFRLVFDLAARGA